MYKSFTIDIIGTKTSSHLKNCITAEKSHSRFDDVHSNDLPLFKVNIFPFKDG